MKKILNAINDFLNRGRYPELVEFPEQTVVIAKDQPQYRPLPAHQHRDESGTITFCWKLNLAARLRLLFTGKLWHNVLTFNQPLQPQLISTDKPEMRKQVEVKRDNVFAFIPIVRQSQRPPEAQDELKRLGLSDVSLENRLEVRNEGQVREIILIGAVGKSWWDEGGITEKEFRNALDQFKKGGGPITVLVNSEGGDVQEGLGIYNAIKSRADEIIVRITGYAVSIASVFPLAAGKVISPKSAIWMTHKAWSFAQGNDDDMEAAMSMLREYNKMLVDIYVAETGKTAAEWEAWMKAETWIRGSKAIEYGLADETDDDDAQASYRPFHPDFIQRCKNLSPEILNSISPKKTPAPQQAADNQNKNTMNRTKMLALLKSWGVEVNDAMTDDQLIALVEAGKPAGKQTADGDKPVTRAELLAMQKQSEVKSELAKLVSEKRITQAQADKFLVAAVADDSVLAALRENPVMPTPAEAVAPESEITTEASPKEIVLSIARFNRSMTAWQKGQGDVTLAQLSQDSIARAMFIEKHAAKIGLVMNANTIPAGLQRNVLLQTVIKDFARKLIPLKMFATVFSNVPLEGTDKVEVPFYDLDTGASTSFKFADGYVASNTTTDVRELQIGKRADADVLDDTKQYDRKYQALGISSQEMARQPYLKVVELAAMKTNKLASDIIAHILSIVTAANYGAAAITTAAALFDSDDLADLKLAVKLWPDVGRGLMLDSAYDAALLKDVSFKHALNAASDSAIKEGKLFPRVFGFDYAENPTIPANGENLVGFAVFQSAILIGFAPVPPIEEVRNDGTTYQIYTDPASGIVFEYRTFGDSQMDNAVHIIESSYGFAKGNGNALKRIVSA